MGTYKELIYEKIGKKALITLDRQPQLNALSKNLKKELADALDEAGSDKEVRVIILTGAGDRAFCAGQELTETMHTDAGNAAIEAHKWISDFKVLYDAFRRQEKVIIAMMNGAAAGSGMQIALLCDFRIGSEKTRMGMTEIDVGFPLITGSGLLWNLVGPARTRDLALTGRLLDSKEADEWGLLTKVFPHAELKERTLEFADFIAAKAPCATAIDKSYYRKLEAAHYHDSYDYAVIAHTMGYASGEPQEYQKRFFEEREAKKKKG